VEPIAKVAVEFKWVDLRYWSAWVMVTFTVSAAVVAPVRVRVKNTSSIS
jgi:hypothetical protein